MYLKTDSQITGNKHQYKYQKIKRVNHQNLLIAQCFKGRYKILQEIQIQKKKNSH